MDDDTPAAPLDLPAEALLWSAEDEAAAVVASSERRNPIWVARMFLDAMANADGDHVAEHLLPKLITPESALSWGDFAYYRELIETVPALPPNRVYPYSAAERDVAIVPVRADQDEDEREDVNVPVLGVLTLVWRSEFDSWLVHELGRPTILDAVARTSPGEAPEYP